MTHPLTIAYFGTADFAVPELKALAEDPGVRLAAVVTQPDKATGRAQIVAGSPVAVFARERGLPLLQPPTLKTDDAARQLTALAPDLFVVAAYGKIIPKHILSIPKLGSVNLHGSLLPNYRGASPIQTAILEGETETGVTLMVMDELVDHGPMVASSRCRIETDDTHASLEEKLGEAGATLLKRHLPTIAEDIASAQPQNHDAATFTKIISREDGMIDWAAEDAERIARKFRAYQPWPGVFFTWTRNGKPLRVKIGRLRVVAAAGDLPAGTTFRTDDDLPAVATVNKALVLEEVQPEGKKMTDGAAFLNGYADFIGSRLAPLIR